MEKQLAILRRLFIGILLVLPVNISASELLVESEGFDSLGGWSVNQQFMEQMGSPYLMAHGLGLPVKDATTTVHFPKVGHYYVYVRTYNWTSPWSAKNGPGKFQIAINGKFLKKILGDKGLDWEWQYAGIASIKDKEVRLSLHDLTGFDGRCDAIYFSSQKPVELPNEGKELQIFRTRLCSLPLQEVENKYDLVVIGAGIAGISAAASAARLGCKVALINDRMVVGGNNSSEIRVHLGGKICIDPYPNLGGMQKEFAPVKGGNAMPGNYYEDQKKKDWLSRIPNLDLYLGYHVNKVHREGTSIVSVTAHSIFSKDQLVFHAPVFADCTGDGSVGFLAGADFSMGRESRNDFLETSAPVKGDNMTMGASVQWYAVNLQQRTNFPEFNYGVSFNDTNCQHIMRGDWTWETGLNQNQIKDAEKIRDYGMLVVYSNWSYLKNHFSKRKEYAKAQLRWVAYQAGKRESRRLLGDYVLSENDLLKDMPHEDGSFITTWSIDLHYPDTVNDRNFEHRPFKAVTVQRPIKSYSVPYRCLYSRNITNLFMAGRDISVTHIALGTVRVMRTCGMMGEVVGMAASLCKKFQINPRQVYFYHIDDLKDLMLKGVGGFGLPNNQNYNTK